MKFESIDQYEFPALDYATPGSVYKEIEGYYKYLSADDDLQNFDGNTWNEAVRVGYNKYGLMLDASYSTFTKMMKDAVENHIDSVPKPPKDPFLKDAEDRQREFDRKLELLNREEL